MSVGSPKVVVRLSPKLLGTINAEIAMSNKRGKPYTLSEFVRKAVCEKLKHLARGRAYSDAKKEARAIGMVEPSDEFDELLAEFD